jgi:DNA-binding NarL/FixJ family response regulator
LRFGEPVPDPRPGPDRAPAPDATAIRVMVVDDHPMVRRGLTNLLAGADDIALVAAVDGGRDAAQTAAREHPHVVLMDVSMPDVDGIEATRQVLAAVPEARVVMLTSYAEDDLVLAALDAGAIGYLLKDADPEELLRGIRAAATGDSPLAPRAAAALLADRGRPLPNEGITPREEEVLRLVGEGLANKQIARRLGISEKTVKAHLTSVFQRLGVGSRTEAALWAQRHLRRS